MRVCLKCKRVGIGVDRCTDKNYCVIADRGRVIVPVRPSDVLSDRNLEGILIEMPPVETIASLHGDAAPREPNPYYIPLPPVGSTGPESLATPGGMAGEPVIPSGFVEAAMVREEGAIVQEVTSGAPDGNPKTTHGIAKPSLHSIPPLALLHLGQAMADGNRKYGLVNWRHDPITMSVYWNAMMRHMLALWDGEDVDPTTGIKHLAYIMANCAILLDAEEQGTLTDDRSPIPGKTAELITRMTREISQKKGA